MPHTDNDVRTAPATERECSYSPRELQEYLDEFLHDVARAGSGYSTGAANIRNFTQWGWFSPEQLQQAGEKLLETGVRSSVAAEAVAAVATNFVRYSGVEVSLDSIPPLVSRMHGALARDDLRASVSNAIVDAAAWQNGYSRVSLEALSDALDSRREMITEERKELNEILTGDRRFCEFGEFEHMVPAEWTAPPYQTQSSRDLMPGTAYITSAFTGGYTSRDPLCEGIVMNYPGGERRSGRWMMVHSELLPSFHVYRQNEYITDGMAAAIAPTSKLHHEVSRGHRDSTDAFALEFALGTIDPYRYPELKGKLFDAISQLGKYESALVTAQHTLHGKSGYESTPGLLKDLEEAERALDKEFNALPGWKKAITKKEKLPAHATIEKLKGEISETERAYEDARQGLYTSYTIVMERFGEIAMHVNSLPESEVREKMGEYTKALNTYRYLYSRDRNLAYAEVSTTDALMELEAFRREGITADVKAPTGTNFAPHHLTGHTVQMLIDAERQTIHALDELGNPALSRLADRAGHVVSWLAEEGQNALTSIAQASDGVTGQAQIRGVTEAFKEIWSVHSRTDGVYDLFREEHPELLSELEGAGLVTPRIIMGSSRLGDGSTL